MALDYDCAAVRVEFVWSVRPAAALENTQRSAISEHTTGGFEVSEWKATCPGHNNRFIICSRVGACQQKASPEYRVLSLPARTGQKDLFINLFYRHSTLNCHIIRVV